MPRLPSAACSLRLIPLALALLAPSAPTASAAGSDALAFAREGKVVRTLDRETLRHGCGEQRVTIDDPYYGRKKAFLACPLAKVLEMGFGEPIARGDNYFLRARDGYTKPASGEKLATPGGWLALADAELESGFEPIDRRQVDPGPFYLVWSEPGQRDPNRWPWPYQLVRIERAPFEREFPNTLPASAPEGAPAWRGFAIFRAECVACHAINGEGGTVGPELNVPKSIVEYRPAEQIKAYVRDPGSFRYTSMPPHPDLTDTDLDDLVAYFEVMKTRKHDPGRKP